MSKQLQLRRGTASAWVLANVILAEGELGVETDTGNWKTGDGVTAWNDLDYSNANLHNSFSDLQGGSSTERYHLSAEEATKVATIPDAADIFDKLSDTTDDISEGTNKFTTQADITRLSDTSGTNTGDQDLSNYPTLVNDAKGNFLVKGGKNYPISNVELDDLTSDYKAVGNTKPYLSFDNPSEDQMVDLNVVPVTWVNELGLRGKFETTLPAGTTNGSLFEEAFSASDGDKLCFVINQKNSMGSNLRNSLRLTSSNTLDVFESLSENYNLNAGVRFVIFTNSGNGVAYFKLWVQTNDVPVTYANSMVINLTKMGEMPSELQTYFGKTNFADLTASEVEEIAPDYVDSVQTVGYKFGESSIEVVVNKGRNLFNGNVDGEYYFLGDSLVDTSLNGDYVFEDTSLIIKPVLAPYAVSFVEKVFSGISYTLKFNYTGEFYVYVTQFSDDTYITQSSYANINEIHFATNSNTNKIVISFKNHTSNIEETIFLNIQLEEGITATEYQPPKSYEETLPEMWSMFGVSDTQDSKKFKRVKLVDAVQADGSIDWSWATSSGDDCLLINIQEDSDHYGENIITTTADSSDTGWAENDDVSVVFDNTGGEGNNTVETYSARPALSFDGVNDYVDCGNGLNSIGESSFSVEFKLKPLSKSVTQRLVVSDENGSSGDWGISLLINSGVVSFFYRDAAVTSLDSSVDLVDGKAHDVTCIRDVSTGKRQIYVDGILSGELSSGDTYTASGSDGVFIGNESSSSAQQLPYEGLFYDVRIWSVALSEPSVDIFGNEAGLEAWYTIDEGAGNILTDHSGNENHGTINGAVWTTGLVSNPADEIELYQNTSPKLLIEHGKNNIFGDNIFMNFETTYNQKELESIIREEKNKTPTLEEDENGVFAITRNGDKIPLGNTNLPDNPVQRWKGYSILNLVSELSLQKVQGKGYFNSFVNLLGNGESEYDSGEVTAVSNYSDVTSADVASGDIIYYRAECKTNNITGFQYYALYDQSNTLEGSQYKILSMDEIIAADTYQGVSGVFKADISESMELRLYISYSASTTFAWKNKNRMIINLTEKGELPPSMQAEYGVTRWDLLSKSQLDKLISYENTVTGWDDDFADVSLRNPGKNLWDTTNGLEQGQFSASTGLKQTSSSNIRCKEMLQVKPNTEYSLSSDNNINSEFYWYEYGEGMYDEYIKYSSFRKTITTTSNTHYINFFSNEANGVTFESNIQLEEGRVATPYEPPLPDTTPLTLGFGYAGVYDEIDFKLGTIKRFWNMNFGTSMAGVSDGGVYSDYKLNSIAVVINKVSGEVKTIQSATTTLTSGFSDPVYVFYQRNVPVIEKIPDYKKIRMINGINNFIAENMFLDLKGTINQRDIELMMTEVK